MVDLRVIRGGEDGVEVFFILAGKLVYAERRRQQSFEHGREVKVNVGPAAGRTLVGIGGVGDVLGKKGHIPGLEAVGNIVDLESARVCVTDPYLGIIVEMKTAGRDVRYPPVFSGQEKYGKLRRQEIAPVFYNSGFFGSGHGEFSVSSQL